MGTLTLEDLIQDVANYCEVDEKKAKEVVFAIFHSMIKELKNEGRIELRGFGVFSTYDTKARKKYNGFKGYSWIQPAKKRVKFAPSSHLQYLLEPERYKKKEADASPVT